MLAAFLREAIIIEIAQAVRPTRGLRVVPPPPALVDDTIVDRFEHALEDGIADVLARAGDSPIVEQVRWHFGLGHPARRGKRLRPRLALQAAFDEGGSFDEALDAALAVECLHNYSLVHDDIEDGDELRHGRATVWARYGVAHGVNAGDGLCAVTYLTLLRNRANLAAERVVAMARTLHETNLAMCAGQAYDIGFETASRVEMDAYLQMIEGKTGALFGAACALGALAAGASERRASVYDAFGRAYGRAFQIFDDISGTWGRTAATGKPPRTDIARRKWTYPIVWALAGGPSEERDEIERRYRSRTPLDETDVDVTIRALDALGARRAALDASAAALNEAERLAVQHGLDVHGTLRGVFAALSSA